MNGRNTHRAIADLELVCQEIGTTLAEVDGSDDPDCDEVHLAVRVSLQYERDTGRDQGERGRILFADVLPLLRSMWTCQVYSVQPNHAAGCGCSNCLFKTLRPRMTQAQRDEVEA